MKKLYTAVLLLPVTCSCALFQRSSTVKNENQQMITGAKKLNSNLMLENQRKTRVITMSNDSLKTAYHIRFWPKGDMIFSADQGLQGEFDSVIIDGYRQQVKSSRSNADLAEQEKQNLKINLNENFKAQSSHKVATRKTVPDYLWIVTCLIVIVFTLFLALRKYGR